MPPLQLFGDDFSDQMRFVLQLSGISEIAEGIEGDRQDDIQTKEENRSSAQIMFAGAFHAMPYKLYKRKTLTFDAFYFYFVCF